MAVHILAALIATDSVKTCTSTQVSYLHYCRLEEFFDAGLNVDCTIFQLKAKARY